MPLGIGIGLAITRGTGVGLGLNAMSPSRAILEADSADLNWVAPGDSTWNGADEFLYLFWAWLGTLYPAFTLEYYGPDGSGGYASPTTVQSGTGSHTFRLYNPAVAGTRGHYFQGSRFTGAFVTPGRSWDLVLLNFGKNYNGFLSPAMEGEFLGLICQLQLAFPAANMVLTNQYKNQSADAYMALMDTAWRSIAGNAPQMMLWDLYNDVSLESSDYVDGPHATATANEEKILPVVQAYWQRTKPGEWEPETPFLSLTAANLFDGNSGQQFANFALDGDGTNPGAANTTPADYAVSATITFSKDTVRTYDGAARSQKMIATAGNGSRIFRNPSSNKLTAMKGKWVTVTLVSYTEAGGNANMGRLGVTPNGTGAAAYTTIGTTDLQGAWVVRCAVIFVPSDATSFVTSFYHDSTSPASTTHAVNLQWATCVEGRLPRAAA